MEWCVTSENFIQQYKNFAFQLPYFVSLFSQLIQAGKGEAIRIRAILRSLVPTEDLVGIISIPLKLPVFNPGMLYTVYVDVWC